jgi:uncharacterized protein (DUF305 family)
MSSWHVRSPRWFFLRVTPWIISLALFGVGVWPVAAQTPTAEPTPSSSTDEAPTPITLPSVIPTSASGTPQPPANSAGLPVPPDLPQSAPPGSEEKGSASKPLGTDPNVDLLGLELSGNDYEIYYLEMTAHYLLQSAVMAQSACLVRTIHSELSDKCQEISITRTQQIQQITGWLKDWYQIDFKLEWNKLDKAFVNSLARMQPAQMETGFLVQMPVQQAMGVETAQVCLKKAAHPELIQWCQDLMNRQTADAQQLNNWLSEWYGPYYLYFQGTQVSRIWNKLRDALFYHNSYPQAAHS